MAQKSAMFELDVQLQGRLIELVRWAHRRNGSLQVARPDDVAALLALLDALLLHEQRVRQQPACEARAGTSASLGSTGGTTAASTPTTVLPEPRDALTQRGAALAPPELPQAQPSSTPPPAAGRAAPLGLASSSTSQSALPLLPSPQSAPWLSPAQPGACGARSQLGALRPAQPSSTPPAGRAAPLGLAWSSSSQSALPLLPSRLPRSAPWLSPAQLGACGARAQPGWQPLVLGPLRPNLLKRSPLACDGAVIQGQRPRLSQELPGPSASASQRPASQRPASALVTQPASAVVATPPHFAAQPDADDDAAAAAAAADAVPAPAAASPPELPFRTDFAFCSKCKNQGRRCGGDRGCQRGVKWQATQEELAASVARRHHRTG